MQAVMCDIWDRMHGGKFLFNISDEGITACTSTSLVFIEKNGLKQHEFAVLKSRPKRLLYNSTTTLLAVCSDESTTILTFKNYTFTTNYTLPPFVNCEWDKTHALKLYSLTPTTQATHEFTQTVLHGKATVAVIDGQDVKITPFSTHCVPPPMCHKKITLDSSLVHVSFSNDCMFVLTSTHIRTFLNFHSQPVLESTIKCPRKARQVFYKDELVLVCDGYIYLVNSQKELILDILFATYTNNSLLLQSRSGKIFTLNNSTLTEILDLSHPHDALALFNSEVISLHGSTLYKSDIMIAENVTSFTTTPDFILATTTAHTLLCISKTESHSRRIERGAFIVAATNTRVVLQMPRGNIEEITPRPLLLKHISDLLAVQAYDTAFTLCRRNRLALTTLLPGFNALKFMEKVNSSSFILQFVNSVPHDIIKSLVPFLEADPGKFKECLVTSYILLEKYSDALSLLKQDDSLLSTALHATSLETLYKASLATYDIQSTLWICQKSQKDPKEYLAFLSKLSGMPEFERRYTIDDYLGFKEKALVSLAEWDPDSVIAYVETNGLYKPALRCFQGMCLDPILKSCMRNIWN